MTQRLLNKRVLITQADDYMGPATEELFAAEGAIVTTDTSDLMRCWPLRGTGKKCRGYRCINRQSGVSQL